MPYKVLLTCTGFFKACPEAVKLLQDNDCELIDNPRGRAYLTFEELSEVIGDVDAVIVGLDQWNEAVYRQAKKLKVMARFGVGVDNIDLVKAKEYGILVANSRDNANAVAELTVAFYLNCLRNIPSLNNKLREGIWERFIGREFAGKRVGLVGFGNIPQLVARKLSGFDVEIIAFDKFPNQQAADALNVRLTTLDEVLSTSDIVSMHLPSLPDTRHTMNKAAFARMKPGSYFVNTGRGPLVDEAALYEALSGGHLTAAASDVFEQEPSGRDNPLLTLPNFICTPHQGAETYETMAKVGLTDAQAIIAVLKGERPLNLLNG